MGAAGEFGVRVNVQVRGWSLGVLVLVHKSRAANVIPAETLELLE